MMTMDTAGPLQGILSHHSSTLNLLEDTDAIKQSLHDINNKILEVQKQIHSLVSENNEEFTNTLLYCKDLKGSATALLDRFNSIQSSVSDPEKGLYTSLIAEITNHHTLQSEIAVHQSAITTLDQLYSHYSQLSDFEQIVTTIDSLYTSKDFLAAASILSRAAEVQGGNLRIHAVLADEYRVRRNTMKKAMHEALRSAVRALVVVVPPSDKRLNASDKYTLQLSQSIYPLLRAIETLGEKEYTIAFTYLAQTIGEFFTFLLSDSSNVTSLEQVNDEWRFTVETTPKKLDHVPLQVVLQVLGQCQEALGIVAKFLFEDNTAFISRLGTFIWEDIANNITKNLLATSIPEDNSQLAEYKAVITAVEALEHTSHQLGYIPDDHSLASSMSKRMLSKARKLLINADHNLTVTVAELSKLVAQRKPGQGKKSEGAHHHFQEEERLLKLLAFPQCTISNAAHELVSLIHDALHAHFTGENHNAMVVRSMVDLFRIVYSSHHKKLADIPHLSMVFHNDCFYIAQCISLIPQQVGGQDTTTESFVDLVHSLRELGEGSWSHTITKQVEQVKEGIEAMGGLADVQEAKRKQAVERGFKIITRLLKTSSETLREMIEAIAEDESHILHALLHRTLQDCEAIFKATPIQGDPNEKVIQFLLSKYVPLWPKFSKTVDLLEMPLIKIVEYFKNGLLDEFHQRELSQLIQGLFSDSPLRKQLLDQLV